MTEQLTQLCRIVFENRDLITKKLSQQDNYFVHRQNDKTILIRNTKTISPDLDNVQWTIILIDGNIWQYSFVNPSVTDMPTYVTAEEALQKIISEVNI